MRYAVQLYTLRKECEKDFIGTLEKVSQLGYEGIELAGTYGLSASELKYHLDRLNLTVVGSHISLDELINNYNGVIDYNKQLGNHRIVCPYSTISSDDETIELANKLESIIGKFKESGMELLYHNHAHEFVKDQKGYLLDELFNILSSKGLKMELDTHWVARAKVDVLEYMEKNKDLLELIHVKDLKMIDDKETTAALGEGILPIIEIIQKYNEFGREWIIVENDNPLPDGLSNIATSMKFLKENYK